MRKIYFVSKKMFVLILMISVLILSSSDAYGYSINNRTENNEYIDKVIILVKEFYPDIEPVIDKITYIYFDNEVCEIALDLSYNNICYGYCYGLFIHEYKSVYDL